MNVFAVIRPMPELAPVTTAIFPMSRDMASSVFRVDDRPSAPASVWSNVGADGPARPLSLGVLFQLSDQRIAERRRRQRLLPGDQLAVDHHVGVPVGDALDPRAGFGEGVDWIELDVAAKSVRAF